MRKSLWMIPVVLLFTALGSTTAHADTVVTNGGGFVTAIDGITLNGSLYNVTFTSTIDNTFSAYAENSSTIYAIRNLIDSDLGNATIHTVYGDIYGIDVSDGYTVVDALSESSWKTFLTVSDDFYDRDVHGSSVAEFYWANFTPAVVATPEPGTAPLTLAGLGVIAVLMWKRRQDALRQPQAP